MPSAHASPPRLRVLDQGSTARSLSRKDGRGHPAALKIGLAPEHDAGIRREAEMAALLKHPALLPILASGSDEAGRAWLLLPLLSGKTLADESWPAEVLVEALTPVADALDLMHSKGWGTPISSRATYYMAPKPIL